MNVGLPTSGAAQDRQGASQRDKMKKCNVADKKGFQDKMHACKNLTDKKNLNGHDRRSFTRTA
jgi:histidinol dehydrogenase